MKPLCQNHRTSDGQSLHLTPGSGAPVSTPWTTRQEGDVNKPIFQQHNQAGPLSGMGQRESQGQRPSGEATLEVLRSARWPWVMFRGLGTGWMAGKGRSGV